MPDASSTDQQIDKHTGTHRHTDTQTRRHTHSLVKKQANKQTNTYRQGHRHTATEPPKQIPDGRWQTQNPYPDADRATRIHQSPMGKPDQEHTTRGHECEAQEANRVYAFQPETKLYKESPDPNRYRGP